MAYRRFYAPPDAVQGDIVVFSAEESHHLTRVVRLQIGDVVEVFDGAGAEYRCRIEDVKPRARARILETIHSRVESPVRVTLVQGLTKFDKFDYIVQKATELGVWRIVPLLSERTEIRWNAAQSQARVARWQKIARAAAKQCRRSVVPEVRPVAPLARALQGLSETEKACKLCLTEREGLALKPSLPLDLPGEFILAVGPEGGWSDTDLATLAAHGYRLVRLGPRILRTETAALVALSVLQYQFGDLG